MFKKVNNATSPLDTWYVHIVHVDRRDNKKRHHISVGPYLKLEIVGVVNNTRMTHKPIHQFKSPHILCNIFMATTPLEL